MQTAKFAHVNADSNLSLTQVGFHKPSDRFFTTFTHNLQYEKADRPFIFYSMDAECL